MGDEKREGCRENGLEGQFTKLVPFKLQTAPQIMYTDKMDRKAGIMGKNVPFS